MSQAAQYSLVKRMFLHPATGVILFSGYFPSPRIRPDAGFDLYPAQERGRALALRARKYRSWRRPANLKGPFYLRYTAEDGSQPFKVIPDCETLDDAIKAAESLGHALLAKSKGLTVPELNASANGLQKLGVCSL
jgi:hypothetical protein